MALVMSGDLIVTWNDITLPAHSNDVTFAEIVFKIYDFIVWHKRIIGYFIYILLSPQTLKSSNSIVKDELQYHHEHCLHRVRTNRQRGAAYAMHK